MKGLSHFIADLYAKCNKRERKRSKREYNGFGNNVLYPIKKLGMIFIKAPELFLFSCRPFFEKPPTFFSALEIDDETGIDLSSGQVVRNSELVLIGSRNPVVGVDILHVHQVENIHP